MKTIIISIFMAMMAIAAQAQQKSFYDFTFLRDSIPMLF